MSNTDIKDVVVRTEKEHEAKLKEVKETQIKEIVQDILEKIEKKKEGIRKLNEEKKTLETSLDDLKSGRLDKLAELVEKSPVAQEVVKIEIHKIIEKEYVPYPVKEYIPYTPWTQPWQITYGFPNGTVYLQAGGSTCNAVYTAGEVKNAAIGTYSVGNAVVSIR